LALNNKGKSLERCKTGDFEGKGVCGCRRDGAGALMNIIINGVETQVCGRRVSDSWSLTVALNVVEGGSIVVAC